MHLSSRVLSLALRSAVLAGLTTIGAGTALRLLAIALQGWSAYSCEFLTTLRWS